MQICGENFGTNKTTRIVFLSTDKRTVLFFFCCFLAVFHQTTIILFVSCFCYLLECFAECFTVFSIFVFAFTWCFLEWVSEFRVFAFNLCSWFEKGRKSTIFVFYMLFVFHCCFWVMCVYVSELLSFTELQIVFFSLFQYGISFLFLFQDKLVCFLRFS